MANHILEPTAQEIADAMSKSPVRYEIGPDGARKVLDDIQGTPIDNPEVGEKWITVPVDAEEVGDGTLRDFMMLHPVGGRAASIAPVAQPIHILRKALGQ
jgi:hypothetical protein